MTDLVITAASQVTGADAEAARLGPRFGRMDLSSRLSLLAVENLDVNFSTLPRERIAICLAARAGSLSTDAEYWKERDAAGGPSPTLFTYTLPSAAIGEIAIRHQLTGPCLCFVGGSGDVLPEAADLLRRGEADACVCVFVTVISQELAGIIPATPAATACAIFLQRGGIGPHLPEGFDRDMESVCALVCARSLPK